MWKKTADITIFQLPTETCPDSARLGYERSKTLKERQVPVSVQP